MNKNYNLVSCITILDICSSDLSLLYITLYAIQYAVLSILVNITNILLYYFPYFFIVS